MSVVRIICEGDTELRFIRGVLAPHLRAFNVFAKETLPGEQGGNIKYSRMKPIIVRALKQPRVDFVTTFFDYYGRGRDFPGDTTRAGGDPESMARQIESEVEARIAAEFGNNFDVRRFRCFITMHEFEGLLFSDPAALARGLKMPGIGPALRDIRDRFESPEHINDSRETAPSKRLLALCEGYDKVIAGNVAAFEVGLDAMKAQCVHFRKWVEWMEGLGPTGDT